MESNIDYIIGFAIVGLAIFFLYRRIRKTIQKGKCASCPIYKECEKEHKIDITDIK